MSKREVWRVTPGRLESLRLEGEEMGELPAGRVRVAVEAVGLNFADVFACLGLYSAAPKVPFVPGLEFAGMVLEAERETGFAAGDRVLGVTRFGGFATLIDADPRALQPLPDGWSAEEGAAFAVQAMTAWYALRRLGDVRPGQTVLVHSAAGGVGLQALAMLEAIGARAVGTVGHAEKVIFLVKQARLDESRVLVRDEARFGDQLDEALGELGVSGFDLILDSLGGSFLRPGYDRLLPGGRLVVFGSGVMMPGGRRRNWLRLGWRYLRRPRLDPLAMIGENRSVMGFNLIRLWDRIEEMGELCGEIRALGLTAPHIGERFGFDRLPEALRRFQSGRTVGKVVVVTGQSTEEG